MDLVQDRKTGSDSIIFAFVEMCQARANGERRSGIGKKENGGAFDALPFFAYIALLI